MEKTRDNWSSRMTFIFAAIGSAVGLGNAWRFPGLAATYGGGAFLLVYVLAMIILGWPLLCMEVALGRKTQKGAAGALFSVNKKFEFVGWAAVLNAFVIACYYAVILAWVIIMIIKGFTMGGMSAPDAGNVFFDQVLHYQSIGTPGFMNIDGKLLYVLIAAWVIIYLCIRKGAHSVGKVVKFTVIIPVVLLIILAINGMVKDFQIADGAGLATLFKPDFAKVIEQDKLSSLFVDAFGQVFYSLSIMMSIMIAYGSFVDKKSDIVKDTMIIAAGDFVISMIAGVVLFTTLSGTGMLESYLASPSGGIGTAFVVYPQAIVSITNNAVVNSIFAVMFYVTLFTLAIDSAFSIVEGVSTAISDKLHISRKVTTPIISVLCLFVSCIFVTNAGLEWLDIVDNMANTYNLVLVGVLECIVIGWFFETKKIREELNRTITPFKFGKKEVNVKIGAWYDWLIKVVAPGLLLTFFTINFIKIMKSYAEGTGGYGDYPVWAQVVAGWAVCVLVFAGAVLIQVISRKSKKFMELDAKVKVWDEVHAEDENSFILAQQEEVVEEKAE